MFRIKPIGRSLIPLFILLSLLLNAVPTQAAAQTDAQALLALMSPEEKVGQLFLVAFDGMAVDEETQIYDLVTNYHVGGVVLRTDNNNFSSEDTVSKTQTLVASLQNLAWEAASSEANNVGVRNQDAPNYIPLWIGMQQIGNGYPGDQILTGLTPMPSQMSIGASWNLELANQVGQVLGSELSSIGINLFLGPNLDVVEAGSSEAANSLGVNTYGGDPFWVGEMGKSLISGLHTGSDNRVMIVAQNFPGTGNSDRSPEFEVATVRKSLDQLKQIELPPYFSVTTPEYGDPGRVDGLMVSHIRYQGFQGNIRETTRPISFDSNALQEIMSLPQFQAWRDEGGLVFTDNLGSESLQRFFDPNGTNFDALSVARNALLAGNDVLYVNNLRSSGDPDAYTTLVSIIDFFVQKYREDSAFAQRVDSSVLRVLKAKELLYEEFNIANVSPSQVDLSEVGISESVTFEVAQESVTMISPPAQEFDTILPSPPAWHEDIVIFTDVRTVSQCDNCPPYNQVTTKSMENALLNLYGPQAGGQILEHNLFSYTFLQLVNVLDNVEEGTPEFLLENLQTANWVIFNTIDIDPNVPGSNALQRLLADRPDLLSGKKVIVFSMGTPIYLDSTNITKLTAYYALYSQMPAFLDVAARVLMQELVPPGALPISLDAVGYDLITITSPDPEQVIDLELVLPEEEPELAQTQTPGVTQTPEPTPLPIFNVGDTLTIRTGRIYDHNQNIVPDGTVVQFSFQISGEPGIKQQFQTTTSAGVAYFNYRIETAGGLEISATSEPALQSETLQINISPEGVTSVLSISPTPLVSPTSTASPTPEPTATQSPTPVPKPKHNNYPTLGEWAVGVIVMGVGCIFTYLIGFYWWGSPRWGLRSSLCALIGGLMAYTFLNLGTSGTKYWMMESGTFFVIEVIVVGLLIGWTGALIWWMRTAGRYPLKKRG
ncbi:MAG: glycoside hydrolase family 3 N-terminal domain-containing protein [Chloroflexota bacterium]|nr:glycoside hydrolase family 3 N-terminal domain-containing protein [Chloroflexota bacterium]